MKDVDVQLIGNVPSLFYLESFMEMRYTCIEKKDKEWLKGEQIISDEESHSQGWWEEFVPFIDFGKDLSSCILIEYYKLDWLQK